MHYNIIIMYLQVYLLLLVLFIRPLKIIVPGNDTTSRVEVALRRWGRRVNGIVKWNDRTRVPMYLCICNKVQYLCVRSPYAVCRHALSVSSPSMGVWGSCRQLPSTTVRPFVHALSVFDGRYFSDNTLNVLRSIY